MGWGDRNPQEGKKQWTVYVGSREETLRQVTDNWDRRESKGLYGKGGAWN